MVSESATWERVIEPAKGELLPEVARAILRFDFRDSDHERMAELAAKCNDRSLTGGERIECENYVHIGDVLALMQSLARLALKRGAHHCRSTIRLIRRSQMAMSHPIHRIRSFKVEAPYTLRVRFDDNTERVIDFFPVLRGELFGPLRDLAVFNQVRLDPEVHTLVWPNGADFDPATLHDWSEQVDALSACARQWEVGGE